jgi:hypothetical protein
MTATKDRRIQRFQFKVQQRLNLADEDLTWLAAYHHSLTAEIAGATDQLRIITNQTGQSQAQSGGKEKKQQSERDAIMAQLRVDHVQRISEIEQSNADEIAQCQQDFQNVLEQLNTWSQQRVAKASADVESDLARTTSAIDRERADIRRLEEPNESVEVECARQSLEFEASRIQSLEDKIQQLSQERLNRLNLLKDRLSESLNILEELEKSHTKKMDSFRNHLEVKDRQYQAKVSKMTDDHRKAVQAQNWQLESIRGRLRTQEKALEHAEGRSPIDRNRAEQEAIQLKKDLEMALAEAKPDDSEVQASADLAKSMTALEATEKVLAEKENRLLQLRTENENLKREIGRLKHESLLLARRTWKSA